MTKVEKYSYSMNLSRKSTLKVLILISPFWILNYIYVYIYIYIYCCKVV